MKERQIDGPLCVCVVSGEHLAALIPNKVDGHEVELSTCKDGTSLLRLMTERVPDVIVMDVEHAVGESGGLLGRVLLRSRDLPVPVIVVGGPAGADTIVECMRRGAADVVPLDAAAQRLPEKLLAHAVDHKLMVQVKRLQGVYERGGKLGEMVGVSPSLHSIFATIKNVAGTDAPVFLSGESGTGKELAANAIHMLSPRSSGRLVAVNCAAIPKDLLESELFGHEKGAFTGADRQHVGRCEQADGGVLFLDEICEMALPLQSKLLRFLQNHTFTRVGGSEEVAVETRIIAATNKEPLRQVESGHLREDLYYRLNVVPIHIPPLRERPEDIPVLAEHFLNLMCEKYDKYFYGFAPEAVRLLLAYHWPGNVRELRNAIERIVVLATTDRVTPELFPDHIRDAAAKRRVPRLEVDKALELIQGALRTAQAPAGTDEVLPFAEVEKRAILAAVRKCGGDISKAARRLGLSRATIYRKLDKYTGQ